jgi:hypothetical protein
MLTLTLVAGTMTKSWLHSIRTPFQRTWNTDITCGEIRPIMSGTNSITIRVKAPYRIFWNSKARFQGLRNSVARPSPRRCCYESAFLVFEAWLIRSHADGNLKQYLSKSFRWAVAYGNSRQQVRSTWLHFMRDLFSLEAS